MNTLTARVNVDASGHRAEFRGEHRRNDWIYTRRARNAARAVCGFLLRFAAACHHRIPDRVQHIDIANRVRFRVVDNRTLDFDIIHNGIFMHRLATVPFSFDIGRSHDISVVVDRTRYAFFCDSLPILEVSNVNPASQTGGMAIIFWDNSGDSKIDPTISNFRVAL